MILALAEGLPDDHDEAESKQVQDAFFREVLSKDAVASILNGLQAAPSESQAAYASKVERMLTLAQATHLATVAELLPRAPKGVVRDQLLQAVERSDGVTSSTFVQMFGAADEQLALTLLHRFANTEGAQAQEVVAAAGKSPHAVVRIEALARKEGSSGAAVHAELRRLLDASDAEARLAALQAMERYRIAAAGPYLVVRIQEKNFHKLPLAERRQCFKTLLTLKAQRCEEVCVALLHEGSLLRGEALESSRELAAEFLGEIAATNEAFYALEKVAHGHDLRTSKGVRDAAENALKRIQERATEVEEKRRHSPQGPGELSATHAAASRLDGIAKGKA